LSPKGTEERGSNDDPPDRLAQPVADDMMEGWKVGWLDAQPGKRADGVVAHPLCAVAMWRKRIARKHVDPAVAPGFRTLRIRADREVVVTRPVAATTAVDE